MTQIINQTSEPTNVEEPKKAIKLCATCNKSNGQLELLRCSKCKKAYYCGVDCQRNDWPKHKKICGKEVNEIDKTNPEGMESTNNKENVKANVKKQKEDGLNQFGKLTHIGTGNFSIIYKTTSKKDGKVYAIKQIEKSKVQRMRKQADVFMEKHCLNKLKDCQHVVKLYKTFQDEISLYFQMEFPEKGELWESTKIFGVIPNSVYKYYVSHIVQAVSVLHNKYQIVHRDLKPENILLDCQNKIKLIDFGTAKDLERPDIKGAGNGLKGKKQFQHYVGTAHYMAPQSIHNKASQKKSDIYSLGGVFYFLKVGSPPFQGGSEYLTFTKSLQTQILKCPELFDEKLQDLLWKMNQKSMENRIDIDQVKKHPYFAQLDFQRLPSYNESLQNMTQDEKYLQNLCNRLQVIMQNYKQPTAQKRKEIYKNQVRTIIDQQTSKISKQKKELLGRLSLIDIQCQCFLNIRDNNNISFTQIYQEVKGTKLQKAEQIEDKSNSKVPEEGQRSEKQLDNQDDKDSDKSSEQN